MMMMLGTIPVSSDSRRTLGYTNQTPKNPQKPKNRQNQGLYHKAPKTLDT
jgi:hypothetical protein